MGIPAIQKARLGAYIMRQLLAGNRRFPLVLMLEPLFRCNLRCPGCGKVDYPQDVLDRQLSVEECLEAAEECGAPVVSIPGGEPLLHPDMPGIVGELVARKKFVYLCTNSLLVERRIDEFTPSPYLTFNIHIDALKEHHDALVGREGVFARATAAIGLLLSRGFRVNTNTTLFAGATPEKAAALFDYLTSLGVEGMTVSAAFGYASAEENAQFLSREEARKLFDGLFALGGPRGWKFNHSPRYLRFLAGKREYPCSPWGSPTRNIFGWQRPCYLLDDGYAASWQELLACTDWEKFGPGRDERCADCMVHCGYESTAVLDTVLHPFRR